MKYKMIFSDFDGTLLQNDFTIGKRTAEKVRDYVSRGGVFVVCTGRMSASIDGYLDDLGTRNQRISVAGFQGSHIVDNEGRVVFNNRVAHRDAITIMNRAKSLCAYTHFYDANTVYVETTNEINLEYAKLTGAPLKVVGDLSAYVATHPDCEILKVMVVVEPSRAAAVKAEYDKMDLGGVQYYFSSDSFIEFVSAKGGKGEGLRRTAEYLSIDPSETIAVGDNQNDIPMLKAAGLGVAVDNARADVKAAANYIAKGNDFDPIAEIIEKFCGE